MIEWEWSGVVYYVCLMCISCDCLAVVLIVLLILLRKQIRDYREGEDRNREEQNAAGVNNRSSMAFSIMCMFLTLMYAGFATLTFVLSSSVLKEMDKDERTDLHAQTGTVYHNNGYIGERFDVRRPTTGFVSPKPLEGTLA